MALFGFEKETLLDLTVNVIPLGILLFFVGAFAIFPSFGVDPVFSGLQFALIIVMFLLLAVLTYYAGKAVEGAEKESEAAELDEPDAGAHGDAGLADDESPDDAALDDEGEEIEEN